MKFAIATVQYFSEHGFDTVDWRKSIDGTKVIVHLDYAKTLIPNIENDTNIEIYEMPSTELMDILNGSEWSNKEV